MDTIRGAPFGDLLRRHRLAAGLTQEALAERAGLSVRAITDLERGVRRAPYRDTVQRLAAALGLDAREGGGILASAQVPRRSAAAHGSLSPGYGFALPAPLTRLIGREQEIDAALQQLPATRLLTFTGPGGVGKTQLALAVARRALADHPDGAGFVDLAPIVDASLVATTIAQAVGLREHASQSVAESLAALLRGRRMLLLLDNFEQVIEAAPLLRDLLAAAPDLRLLVTSRVLLRVAGEREFVVPPLPVPESSSSEPAALAQVASVALFVERAAEALPDFALTGENAGAVAAICRRLDGLPLALEFAAARVRLLPPAAILARLERRLPLLTAGRRDAPARQQSLRDTLRWSYDLLRPEEQRLFRRLGVFVGGWTLDAVEAVCRAEGESDPEALDELETLVESSLVQRRDGPDGWPRFGMLETLREFSLEQLSSAGELPEARRHHAVVFLALAETAEPHLRGPEQRSWLDTLDAEHDNLRAALAWAAEADPDETGARLVCALNWFWQRRAHLSEAARWVAAVLRRLDPAARTILHPRALLVGGRVHWGRNQYAEARPLFESALALARDLGDIGTIAEALAALGMVHLELSDAPRALPLIEESVRLYRRLDDAWGLALALTDLGMATSATDAPAAEQHFRESLGLWRRQGDGWGRAIAAQMYARLLIGANRFDEARTVLEEALAAATEVDNYTEVASALRGLSLAAQSRGDEPEAVRYAKRALAVSRERADRPEEARALTRLGILALLRRDFPEARAHYTAGLALYHEEEDWPSVCLHLLLLGMLSTIEGDLVAAEEKLRDSLARSRTIEYLPVFAGALEGIAAVRHAQGRSSLSARLLGAAAAVRERGGVAVQQQFRALYERTVKAVRTALGEGSFAAAYAEGRALSVDEAVALALAQTE